MNPEPEFRVAVAYLLLMRAGIWWWLVSGLPRPFAEDDSPEWGLNRRRVFGVLARAVCFAPLLIWVVVPGWLTSAQLQLPTGPRWLATVPAALSIVFLIWARRSLPAKPPFETVVPSSRGPLRWIRYPLEAADAWFYLSVAFVTGNWFVAVAALFGTLFMLLCVLSSLDARRRQMQGHACDEEERGGALLPRLGPAAERQYTVPKRFGMAAIVALTTAFGLLFGALKYMNAPPVFYLFVASEVAAICLVQIVFGSAPRGGSILTGAILLPFWVALTIEGRPNWMPVTVFWFGLGMLIPFGGLLGYCIGALAAGFFLVMDLLDPLWSRDPATAGKT